MITALALLLLAAGPLSAATVTVDPKGTHKTLKDALLAAQPGDTLTFAQRGYVGVTIRPRTEAPWGPEIWEVAPASLAEQEGVHPGRILAVDGKPVAELASDDTRAVVEAGPPGSKVRLKVVSDATNEIVERATTRERISLELGEEFQRIDVAYYFNDVQAADAVAEQGAKKGSVDCQRYLARRWAGWKSWEAGRHAKACAEAGDKECMWRYANMRQGGNGAPKDPVDAARWLRRSAEAGDPYGAYFLAEAYAKGLGLKVDKAQARYWLDKALAAGAKGEELIKTLDGVVAAKEPEPFSEDASPTKPAPGRVVSDADTPSYKLKERIHDAAVVVGVETYPGLPKADWAERDAEAMRAHLIALGFPERHVFSLKGGQATRSALAKELEARLPSLVGPKSTVFFYFSGHGSPDPRTGDAYLVPVDGDPKFLAETGYPLARLYASLGKLKAKRVVVALDSCFSGAGGRSVLPKGVRPLVAKTVTADLPPRVAALTASAADEISGSSDAQGHGLFTYHLLTGLNAGKTRLGDLAEHLRPRVQDEARRENRDQTPQLSGVGAAEVELGR